MKTLVTHISPDLDALTACWLIIKFLPGWNDAKIDFVAAGSTLDKQPPDASPDIIHVDTGFGKFDHHQVNEYICASTLVLEYLIQKEHILEKNQEALKRMIAQVNEFDHFAECNFPDATNDRYEFMLYKIIEGGFKRHLKDDTIISQVVFNSLESILHIFLKKVEAEKELQKGFEFNSYLGKTLILESGIEETLKLALKKGFKLVARRDPRTGYIRIKTLPDKNCDLESLYKKIIALDPQATWYLHVSHNMLLNGSSKNPHTVPSKLTRQQLIEIIQSM